jgi:hypothetical protein
MDLENVDPSKSINPHSVGAPGLEDDAQWLENVWTEYVRPKYKLILQKWYKDTGGGARTLENFSNYCKLKDGNYPWMLWVYYLDSKSDFLLASRTQGSPPWLADSEAGFEMVADDEDGVARSSREDYSAAKKKRRTTEVVNKLEEQGKKLDKMFARVDQFLDSKMKREDETDQTFKLMARYRTIDREIKEIENDDDDTLGVVLKLNMIKKLKETKRAIAKKIADMESVGDKESTGSEEVESHDDNDVEDNSVCD